MKIIVIGDIHGRDIWKQIVKQEFDKIIFLGDYLDSYDLPVDKQRQNLIDILEFKANNRDKVELLIGNHDFQYLPGINETYSGYNGLTKLGCSQILSDAVKNGDIKACHQHDNILFSHAGITQTWLDNNGYDVNDNMVDYLNNLLVYTPYAFKFMAGETANMYGDDVTQSPIWVRPKSLNNDKIKGYIQVVGHTGVNIIELWNGVVLTDSLAHGNYLTIENNKFTNTKI